MPALRQTASLVAGGLLLAAGLGLGATSATAVGTLPAAGKAMTIAPAQGNDLIRPSLTTSAACPAGSVQYFPYLYGPGLPDDGQPMNNIPTDVATTPGGFTLQTDFTFKDTAAKAGTSLTAGAYVVRVVCLDDLGNVKDAFTRQVTFSSATAWTVSGANPTPTPTATSTATSSATPTVSGSPSATPTATTTPSASPTARPVVTATPFLPGVLAFDEKGDLLPPRPTLVEGDFIGLVVSGFAPNEPVNVFLEPGGEDLGGDTADEDGFFEGAYVVPDLDPGDYTLSFRSDSRTVTWAFRVGAPVAATPSAAGAPVSAPTAAGGGVLPVSGGTGSLPATGAGVSTQLLLAVLLVLAGIGATWAGLPRGRHERRRFASA